MSTTLKKIIITLALFTLCHNSWADLSGDWEGKLSVNGVVLPIVIHLNSQTDEATGTLDSPSQGAFDIPMTKVEYSAESLMFEVASISAHYSGKLDNESGKIKGNFIQGGVLPLELNRVAKQSESYADSSAITDILGQWGGTVEIPGNPLSLILHVTNDDGVIKASADSPDQGATGLTVDQITLEKGVVNFTMKTLGVEYTGTLSKDLQTIQGDFKQQGMQFKLALQKDANPKQVYHRPQNPEPPFSYHIEEVVVENKQAEITLAGTLTLPKDKKVKAAAVMITGSGPQDRDETVFEHKPFWIIADYLTQHGYAILRMDDRGVGQSTGDFKMATSEDFVSDISAGVDFLQQYNGISADKVGVIGHSEGGMVGPMLAVKRDDLAFVIMLAGPGIPITDLLAEQKYLIALANGGDKDALTQQREIDLKFNQLLAKHATSNHYRDIATQFIEQQKPADITDETVIQTYVDNVLKQVDTVWFRYFIAFDPTPYLQQVTAPLLAINGTKDLQVAAASNLAGIEKTLKASGHDDYTILSLENLNHLLQSSDTGSPTEYVKKEQTIAETALDAMKNWLDARFE